MATLPGRTLLTPTHSQDVHEDRHDAHQQTQNNSYSGFAKATLMHSSSNPQIKNTSGSITQVQAAPSPRCVRYNQDQYVANGNYSRLEIHSLLLTSWFSRPVHSHLDGMGIGGVLDWVRENTDGDSEHLPCKDYTDKKLVWHFIKCWQGRQYFKSHMHTRSGWI